MNGIFGISKCRFCGEFGPGSDKLWSQKQAGFLSEYDYRVPQACRYKLKGTTSDTCMPYSFGLHTMLVRSKRIFPPPI